MTYSQKIKNECFAMFCDNLPVEKIAASFKDKPTSRQIWDWIRIDNWYDKKKDVIDKTSRKLRNNLAELQSKNIEKREWIVTSKFIHMRNKVNRTLKDKDGKELKDEKGLPIPDTAAIDSVMNEWTPNNVLQAMKDNEVTLGGSSDRVGIDVNVSVMSVEIQAILQKVIEEKRITFEKEAINGNAKADNK